MSISAIRTSRPQAATATATATASPRTRLRLTRRGRVVFGTLAAAPVLAAGIVWGAGVGGAVATSEVSTASFERVTVQQGDSLWEIAGRLAPQQDPRDAVAALISLNQLGSSSLSPGQELAIPTSFAD